MLLTCGNDYLVRRTPSAFAICAWLLLADGFGEDTHTHTHTVTHTNTHIHTLRITETYSIDGMLRNVDFATCECVCCGERVSVVMNESVLW